MTLGIKKQAKKYNESVAVMSSKPLTSKYECLFE